MDTSIRSKRARSLSSASSSSSSSSSSTSSTSSTNPSRHPAKFHRPVPTTGPASAQAAYVCCLPPTCHVYGASTTFGSAGEMERHQEMYHRYVCRVAVRDKDRSVATAGAGARNGQRVAVGAGTSVVPDVGNREEEGRSDISRQMRDGSALPESFAGGSPSGHGQGKGRWKECGKVFPDERFLTLHHTETHDPIARTKQNQGQKIFECFLPAPECGKVFLTPAKRRHHLVGKHKYPAEFFFAITNHGLNLITEQEGLAASLIRPQRPRPPPPQVPAQQTRLPADSHRNGTGLNSGSGYHEARDTADMETDTTPAYPPPTAASGSAAVVGIGGGTHNENNSGKEVEDLAKTMESSLAFVPRNVRRSARLQQQQQQLGAGKSGKGGGGVGTAGQATSLGDDEAMDS